MKSAAARYRDVDLAARVESASPHGLVKLLYEELLLALDTLASARNSGGLAIAVAQHGRAMTLLHALEAGLSPTIGGQFAADLAIIYRQMRRQLASAHVCNASAVIDVRLGVANLAEAWTAIASSPGTSASSRSASYA